WISFGTIERHSVFRGVSPAFAIVVNQVFNLGVRPKGDSVRLVFVMLLLASQTLGQAQSNSQSGTVEFYTTQAPGRLGALVIYRDNQRLGEVTPDQSVR